MINLEKYGFSNEYLKEISTEGCIPARITQVHREQYKVVSCNGESNAKLKGSLYANTDRADEFPAVGDFVLLRYNDNGVSQIVKLLPRKSKFSRPDYSGHIASYVKTILEQVVAANFDYVFILASLNNDFNIGRILRYITVSWESGGTPVVLLTKADLVEDYSEQLKQIHQQAVGVDIIVISAATGKGMDQLTKFMKPGSTIVFLGSSGVGKSTLVNALAGEKIMEVNTIREDDSKGRHTTTHRQLILLTNGVMIIDTPGMRELGMWDIKDGLSETFSDIEELFTNCRYFDCTHTSEPGCAILKALDEGSLEKERWKNYLRLQGEIKFTEDKTRYLKAKKEFHKKISNKAKDWRKTGKIQQ